MEQVTSGSRFTRMRYTKDAMEELRPMQRFLRLPKEGQPSHDLHQLVGKYGRRG